MTPFDVLRDAKWLDALEPDLASSRDELLRFAALVSFWGKKTDLVAAKTPRDLVDVLFADALALRGLVANGARVLDVGAGAGAPAIPLALLRPDLRLRLLEPRRRRVAFMRTAVGQLGLGSRVEVIEGRLEPGATSPSADVALSRATFRPSEWLGYASGLAPRVLVLLAREEPPQRTGWNEVQSTEYRIESTGAPRKIVAYERA